MNLLRFLAVFAVLLSSPLSQQSVERQSDPNSVVTLRGGSGSNLLPKCQAEVTMGPGTKAVAVKDVQQAVDGSYCGGYILGVVDSIVGITATERHTTLCIPANADADQLVRVVVKYLADNPANLNEPAGPLVAKAMLDAFPCK